MFQQPGVGEACPTVGDSTRIASNLIEDLEVVYPPEDTVSGLEFSPSCLGQTYLASTSWDNAVRCWEVLPTGRTVPKAMKQLSRPLLDLSWCDDGTKIFVAGGDNKAHMWDLVTDQMIQVAEHNNTVKTCHWIKTPQYACLMTGSWDRTVKFWDTRTSRPMLMLQLPERVYCADVAYPVAVVGTADQNVISYSLESTPTEILRKENCLECQTRCIAITTDKFRKPIGYAIGGIKGRVAVQYAYGTNRPPNYSIKCHRTETEGVFGKTYDVYAVNDVAFHFETETLATAGSNGNYTFWNLQSRRKIKSSDHFDQPITKCTFSKNGCIFAFSKGYDWSRGYEYNDVNTKPKIFIRSCYDEIKLKPFPL